MSTTGWIIIIVGVAIVVFFITKALRTSGTPSESEIRRRLHRASETIETLGDLQPPNNPVCDICSKSVNITECYFLTTAQVATKEAYWEYAFTHQWSYVYSKDPQGNSIGSLAQQQAGQSTAWAVCETCSQMFQFDRDAAQSYAQQGMFHFIPGGGPADLNQVLLAAAMAWKKLYGSLPSSIRIE